MSKLPSKGTHPAPPWRSEHPITGGIQAATHLGSLQDMGEGFTHCSYLWLVHAMSAQSPSPLEPGRVQTQGPPHPLTSLLPYSQLSILAVFWPNTQLP